MYIKYIKGNLENLNSAYDRFYNSIQRRIHCTLYSVHCTLYIEKGGHH